MANEPQPPQELIEKQAAQILQLQQENRLLNDKVQALLQRIFGRKSEKLTPGQLELLLGDQDQEPPGKPEASPLSPAAEAPAKQPRRKKAPKPRYPEDLPVHETVLIPDVVQGCPEAWRYIGSETSDKLDFTPARFFLARTTRKKYVHRHDPDHPPVIAPLPETLQERGGLGTGLLTHIVLSKYADHLPLYRQQQIYARQDVHLPRSTLSDAIELVAHWLAPIAREIRRQQLTSGYLQVDETPIRYQSPGTGKTSLGYFWTLHQPDGYTSYHWDTRRSAAVLHELLPDFQGTLQCDGYSAYPSYAAKRDGTDLSGCWAHARRYMKKAVDNGGVPRAIWLLHQINQLYLIERQLRESRAGPTLRQLHRHLHIRPLLDRIENALKICLRTNPPLPQSPFGKAIGYIQNHWKALERYAQDGRLEIDNNLVENAIRPTAIGKKNWLFIGDAQAGERSAIIYTVITSCRNHGIDPSAYLRDILERLPTATTSQIPDLLPRAWQDPVGEAHRRRAAQSVS